MNRENGIALYFEAELEDRLKELCLGVPASVELASKLRKSGVGIPEDILSDEELVSALMEVRKE